MFKRELYTLIQKNILNYNKLKPNNISPTSNKLYNQISKSLEKIFSNDYDNMTNLHRWCNTTSPKYKNTCDWEKKLDSAGRDNCYSN